jgi:hypothetical protein
MDLIKYAKKVDVRAYPCNLKHKSAYEFARQIASPKLYKINPNFKVTFEWLPEDGPSKIYAEFSNGLKWDIPGDDKTCADLRYEFFQNASLAEEDTDVVEEVAAKPAAGGKKK